MSRIWRYVLAHDTGMAPCVDDGVLTLTCCKPMIRKNGRRGEWVIGFVPTRAGRGRVAWVGQIADVLHLGEYEARFGGRQDALYRLDGYTEDGTERLIPLRDDYHADADSQRRDWRGKHALIFEPFWYWGRNAIAAPDDIADLAHYHVGQSTKRSSPDRIARLEAWVRLMAEPGVQP
jgi:hypothetical protein